MLYLIILVIFYYPGNKLNIHAFKIISEYHGNYIKVKGTIRSAMFFVKVMYGGSPLSPVNAFKI